MSLVFVGNPSNGHCGDLFRMEDDSSEEVVVGFFLPGAVPLSGYEDGPSCIAGM